LAHPVASAGIRDRMACCFRRNGTISRKSVFGGAQLLRPLVKRGPIRCLKLLKLSLIESHDLRRKQVQLRRMISSLDKITRLIFSYAKAQPKLSAPIDIASSETAILDGLKKEAQYFQQEFETR